MRVRAGARVTSAAVGGVLSAPISRGGAQLAHLVRVRVRVRVRARVRLRLRLRLSYLERRCAARAPGWG